MNSPVYYAILEPDLGYMSLTVEIMGEKTEVVLCRNKICIVAGNKYFQQFVNVLCCCVISIFLYVF